MARRVPIKASNSGIILLREEREGETLRIALVFNFFLNLRLSYLLFVIYTVNN